MLRITIHTNETGATLQLEGRLTGSTIREAEHSWQTIRARYQGRPLCLDLRAVTFVDTEGKVFMKQAYEQGASFLCSGCLVRSYVEEIMKPCHEVDNGAVE
jgi:anti-anti-sigma regulatory factor